MSYVDEGPRTDSAVLMVHGNPTWSFYYRDLIRTLAPTRRCVAPDHVGMGLSEKPARAHSGGRSSPRRRCASRSASGSATVHPRCREELAERVGLLRESCGTRLVGEEGG